MASLPANAVAATGRFATVVRADKRTGKLVRAVVTPAVKPVRKREVPPAELPAAAAADPISRLVEKTAREYDVDPLLVHSVIKAESNYNPFAVSPKGARGLMQLIPATARRFGVLNTFDARQNVEAGVRYLRYLQDLFGDDRLAIAAYNAGEGAVIRHGTIPPYRETQEYVKRVGKHWESRKRAQSRTTAAEVSAELVKPPEFRPLVSHLDEQGRLHLRTR